MGSDNELLEIAVDRKEALSVLADGPRHREALQEEIGVSKTTCHRIIRAFDEQGLIRRTDDGYALTLFGQLVAQQAARFDDRLDTATRLRPLLDEFESWDEEFDPEIFTREDIEWEIHADESFSIDRGVERIRGTRLLRVLDWNSVPDLYYETILEMLASNEAKVESVYPASEVRRRLERFPDLHDELIESGASPRYWIYEDVPTWGMSIYDDSLVELRAYEPQSGGHIIDAVTESPVAVDWACDVFADYRERAKPVTAVDGLADWGDYTW